MTTNIKQKIDSIAECIYNKIQNNQIGNDIGLYSGDFGILLFLFYYSRYSKKDKYISLTEKFAEELFNTFPQKIRLHTFCSGLSGIMYLIEFLRENGFIDMDISEVQSTFDEYLILRMRQDMQKHNHDFMHGALGVGLYFLKKGSNKKSILELIDFLYNTAEFDVQKKVCKWKSVISAEKNIIGYNISLSHGISSIIIFLSHVIRSGIIEKKVMEMLNGSVNYVLSQQIDIERFGSCFPSLSLDEKSYPITGSRLAWCYGDLGIAMALWQAGNTIKESKWIKKGLDVLQKSTQRLDISKNKVCDAGICHGSAGIALIYHHMYIETQLSEFKDATSYWLNKTLKFSQHEDGLAGYKTYFSDEWISDYSLLTGISGIGLALLSCIEEGSQCWDEMILL